MITDGNETEDPARYSENQTTIALLREVGQQYRHNPEIIVPFFLYTVLVVAAQAGITTRTTSFGTVPTFARWVWPMYAVAFVSLWIGIGISFLTAADSIAGRHRPFRERLQLAVKRLPSMLFAGVISGLAVGGGLLALVIPGVYLMLKFSLAFPACVIDDLDAVTGLRRGWFLTSGSLSTVFGLLIVYGAVLVVTSVFVTVFFSQPGKAGIVGPFIHNSIMTVVSPLFALAFGHLYVVRRG